MIPGIRTGDETMKKEKTALIIGRFQPFHLGHLKQVEMLSNEHSLIIAVGSAQYSHTLKNPFTAGERIHMISETLMNRGIHAVIVPVEDVHRHSLWVSHIISMVPPFDVVCTNEPLTKQLFTERGFRVMGLPFFSRRIYSGTEIRKRIASGKKWERLVPQEVARIIKDIHGDGRIIELAKDDKMHGEHGTAMTE